MFYRIRFQYVKDSDSDQQINNMQGRVDLKFRIHGDKQAGTLYFTSIRPKQEGAWRIGKLILHLRPFETNISAIQGHYRF
jgi:hypothetical protein